MTALKIVLAPFALIAAVFLAMIVHISTTTLHHRLTFTQTTARILAAQTLCEVTYQPADAVLRAVAGRAACDAVNEIVLPPGGSTPRIFMGEFGRIAYDVAGIERTWDGKLSDAGLYNVKAGETVAIYYDPASPETLDTAQAKGWFGGLVIFAVCGGLVAFYIWLVWPRGKTPRGPGIQPTVQTARVASKGRRQGFGKA